MKPENIKPLLETLGDYYNKDLTSDPIVQLVWTDVFAPLSPQEATELIEYCLKNHQWLPAPNELKAKFADRNGKNFEKELREAIALYACHGSKAQSMLADSITEAIRTAGGVRAFLNASDEEWSRLKKDYVKIRIQSGESAQIKAFIEYKRNQLEAGHANEDS